MTTPGSHRWLCCSASSPSQWSQAAKHSTVTAFHNPANTLSRCRSWLPAHLPAAKGTGPGTWRLFKQHTHPRIETQQIAFKVIEHYRKKLCLFNYNHYYHLGRFVMVKVSPLCERITLKLVKECYFHFVTILLKLSLVWQKWNTLKVTARSYLFCNSKNVPKHNIIHFSHI